MDGYLYQKVELKKKDLYSWIKQTLVDAGWENVSSRPSTDFDVFYSPGESGVEKLFFQIKEYAGTTVGNALTNSRERYIEIKLLKSYTPGDPGQAGLLDRANEPFRRLNMSQGTVSPESDMLVYFHVNKNRIIWMTEYPVGLEEDSVLTMIGRPDQQISKSYPGGKMIYFTTAASGSISMATEEADSTKYTTFNLESYELIPPKWNNLGGTYFCSEIAVGTKTEGFRALIDGVYAGVVDRNVNGRIMRNRIFKDRSGNKYSVFYLARLSGSTNAYYTPSDFMILMTERGEENGAI